MAVDAVASVVLQKLRDLLLEESSMKNRVIGGQLEQMQKALEEMRGFFMDAANKEKNVEAIKKWSNEYLSHLYSVEDSIESFALRITRQRKRLGFLMNHALFLKKFTACKMLSRKLDRIQRKIKVLNGSKPDGLEDTSVRGRHPQQIQPCFDSVCRVDEAEKDEEKEEDDADGKEVEAKEEETEQSPPQHIESFFGSVLGVHEEVEDAEKDEEKHDADGKEVEAKEEETEQSPPQHIESFFGSVLGVHEEVEDAEKDEEEHDADGKEVEAEEEEKEQSSFSFVGVETADGHMRRTYSSPTVSTKQGSPRRLFSEHPFKTLWRSNASLIRERCQQSKLMYSYSYNEEELSIIGYQRKVTELRKRLENWDDRIISVVGELGSGKTMLARAVYGNRTIKDQFKPCAWATIFKESTPTDILLNLLKQVNKKSKEQDGIISTEESLKCKILQLLEARRYLIVLDGVQSFDQWESLKDAFPDEQNGSKIILTTREEQVAVLADPRTQPHSLEKLDDKESWILLSRKAGLLEKDPEGSLKLKERIIRVCKGLPLNIVLLGSLLSTKKDKREWTREWSDILDSHENWQTSEDIVMLSYNDLDAHLKLCLVYMTLFPKELDIPVRRLQRLWLAEGFVERPQNQGEFQEDVAEGYFENLVKRSLIMVSKLRSDGSPRRCRLLGVLHDLLLARARDISLFHVHGGSGHHEDGPFGKRRLIEYADAEHCPLKYSENKRLRSYISFNSQKKDTPAKYVGTLVSNMIGKGFGLMRVLDLEGVYKPSLPDNLGDLFHLRYLGLRWTFLDKLPKSVGELCYLETLDLKRTFINRIPHSIWKLKHLRHLNLNEVHLDKDMPLHSRGSLPKLLTLWGLSVNQESPVKIGLSKLTHLRELGISFRLSKHDDDTDTTQGSKSTSPTEFTQDLVDWISKLTALRSLRLRSKDDSGCPADLSLNSFSRLEKLSCMNLFGKLQKLPDVNQFPPNIKVLTLSVSHLHQDPMPILGQLSGLTVLRLLANSYLGETMDCPSGTFENLEVLKLWMLKDLRKWEVGEGAMKKLKELNIRCCSKLENIPNRLLQQKTFEDLILNNMPPEFKENVDKNNQCKVSITVKNYDFEDN